MKHTLRLILAILFGVLPAVPLATAATKPFKVFILAGQSNMEGQAKVETFDYIGDDPATAPLLKEMRGPDGKPRVCERVWISYLTGSPDKGTLGEGTGKLTADYGSRSNPTEDGGKIGPEFTFGIYAFKAYDGPILIIKTAWGGKSLNTDFCPPSVGRTTASLHNWVYSLSDDGLWVHLYGGNELATTLADRSPIKLTQQADYPWDGKIRLTVKEAGNRAFAIRVRIPGWTENATLSINGEAFSGTVRPATYYQEQYLFDMVLVAA